MLRTYRIGEPGGDGLRLAVARYLPRGVPKQEYPKYFDLWLPLLAPTRELLQSFRKNDSVPRFFSRYRAEMKRPEPRQVIALLALISRQMEIALGCYCEDESRCHRAVLRELIEAAWRDHRGGKTG